VRRYKSIAKRTRAADSRTLLLELRDLSVFTPAGQVPPGA